MEGGPWRGGPIGGPYITFLRGLIRERPPLCRALSLSFLAGIHWVLGTPDVRQGCDLTPQGMAQEVSNAMATETRTGFASKWRELARMPTFQVPVVLGGFIAALAGILTYAFDAMRASAIVAASAEVVYLIIFGIFGLIGYGVSKHNVQNGSLVAAIAGLALVAIAGGTIGLLTGFLCLAG